MTAAEKSSDGSLVQKRVFLIPKGTGDWRMVADYQNCFTVLDKYPLSWTAYLRCAARDMHSSKIDLVGRQIPVKALEKAEIAFITTHRRIYEWPEKPFGPGGAASVYSRLINRMLQGLLGKQYETSFDDTIFGGRLDNNQQAKLNWTYGGVPAWSTSYRGEAASFIRSFTEPKITLRIERHCVRSLPEPKLPEQFPMNKIESNTQEPKPPTW
eukprot:Gregarina_sp_Poly_1__751@NODE_117_length_13667_cov_177_395147_g104_i0_p8_GENE_NODE_117_length_13667_cov_177_395147_g104_i0NODE_117_length_13667_cov_177_395147_g104_i0_p8_ORF_typecomplete_len212_score13_23_NODE_117_length_13667_cov_177_395147_g104_i042264861